MVCRIAIIGDSSSSGIGLGKDIYPAKLYPLLQKKFNVQILNCATPGLTSADASRYYDSELRNQSLDFLIIYLGNNEGATSTVPKGYYSQFKTQLTEYFTNHHKKKQLKPIISPPRFEFSYQVPSRTIATTSKEFHRNLRRIIRHAIRQQVRVILLNPIANSQFPSGVSAVNSTYFCNLDTIDPSGSVANNKPVDETSEALHKGLECFVAGNNDKASNIWKPLVSINNVAGFIARHNLACTQLGARDNTAENQLRALLGEYDIYDSALYYNLAQIKKEQRDFQTADDLLKLAVEKDTSSYRIQQEYRDVITCITHEENVSLLDLKSVLEPTHFIDYCHPTSEGHNKIAHSLAEIILQERINEEDDNTSSYKITLPSPNYLVAPSQTLIDYYSIDWPIQEKRIANAFSEVKSFDDCRNIKDKELAQCIKNFFQCNIRHPIFTNNIVLTDSWMPRRNEILTFPEYFIHRILYNYNLEFENSKLIKPSITEKLEQIRYTSAEYESIILSACNKSLDMNLDVRPEYFTEIISKTLYQLIFSNKIYRVMISDRIRTIKTWYTREAFRFGTQSRISMLYARLDIEIIIESLIVALVIANKLENERVIDNLYSLLSLVLDLVLTHEQHLKLFHQNQQSFAFLKYKTALIESRHAIKTFVNVSEDGLTI